MKNILVAIEDHHHIASVLTTTRLVAEKFSSRIEAIPLGPDFEALIAANFTFPVSVSDEKARREYLLQLKRIFQNFTGSPAAADGKVIDFAWNGDNLFTDTKFGAYGRVFDLSVVGRPGTDSHDPRQPTLEAALFDSGRPILVAPPTPPALLGEVIAISWNGSTETARTVSFAMPFLKLAKKVIVLEVTSSMAPGPSAELLAQSLRRHDLEVTLDVVADGGQHAGRTFLSRAKAHGADLLVKGGYTQSRLRQMIFGGATSQILAETEIPVLMGH